MSGANQISRRQFLQTTGSLLICVAAQNTAAQLPLPRSLAANPELDTWLRIGRDGSVTVFSGKCELGQGIKTALAQVVADELDVSIARIQMETVDTAHSPNEGRTVGSNSVPDSGRALRLAAAQARQILLDNAGRRLGIAVDQLRVEDGLISPSGGSQSVSYWQLLSEDGFNTDISGEVEPKHPQLHRYVGAAEPRIDLPAKFFGEAAFIHDLVLPGMLHARIVRAEIAASRLISADYETTRNMPGVTKVVQNGSFLAVLARREEQAVAAAEVLRASARWETVTTYPDPAELVSLLMTLPCEDSVIAATSSAANPVLREFEAQYSRPFIAHASIGPSAALAQWDGTTLTVWSHAQGMYPLRDAIANVVDLPVAQIRCIHADGAGCYGHNGADDVACDAALIALEAEGAAVRLLWSRRDEFCYEPYGSAMSLRVAAGLDASNRIVNWRYDLWSCSHSTRPSGGEPAGGLLAARAKSNPLPNPPVTDIGPPTGGADRNAVPLYSIPNQRVIEHLVLEPPLRNSALRSLGAHGNVFAIESFVDELARNVDADPFEFRLEHLEDPRGRAVIESVRELAEGFPSRPPVAVANNQHVGRGMAFARYKNLSTYLALVAEVVVDEDSGTINLRHVFAAVDAGQTINPDGIKNQVEGGIVQTASWTLKEEVRFSPDRIESVDWATYPILRFEEVPKIDVQVINRPELPFVGAGECTQGPTSAAIANAVATASGIRLRDLPFTAERVLAALSA